MATKMPPPVASSRSAWRCVASYVSSETAATATRPGWPASGAAVILVSSSSMVRVAHAWACRIWLSSAAVSSGVVPASGLAPRTRPAESTTCVMYSPGTGFAAVAGRGPVPLPGRYRAAWASWAVSWESMAPSWAADRAVLNSHPPTANKSAAAAANARARRSRMGMLRALPGVTEPVADAPDRLDVVPAERRVDLAPQVVHVLVDDVRATVVGEVPHRLDDLRAGKHVAGMPKKQLKQGELLRGKPQFRLRAPRPLRSWVELHVSFGQDDGARPVTPAGERPQPGGEFQPAHPVSHAVSRGQHEHRGPLSLFPEPAAELESVEVREHDIQDDRPVGVLGGQPHAVLAAAGDVDGVPFLLKRAFEEPGHPGFIFHHEHPHAPRLGH